MAVHHWPQSLSLLLAGFVLSFPILGVSGAYHSGIKAIEDGVRGEFGYVSGWKLQASEKAASAVSSAPGVTAVEVGSAAFSTRSARVVASLWTTSNDDAPLGLLTEGRHATASDEITLTLHLAQTLEVRVGEVVTVDRGDDREAAVRIVGITVDPANRNADLGIATGENETAHGSATLTPTYWITPSVSSTLDYTPGLNASSVAGTIEARLEHVPGGIAALRRLTPAVTGLAIITMLAAVAAQIPATRRDMDALQAAGMSRVSCWRVVLVWIGVLVACGAAVGVASALVALRGLADPVSSALGQRWITAVIPALPAVWTVAVPLLIAVVPSRWLAAAASRLQRPRKAPRTLSPLVTLVGVGLAAAGLASVSVALLQAHGHLGGDHFELLGLSGSLSAVVGLYWAAAGLSGTARRGAVGKIVGNLVGRTVVGTTVALVVGVAGAAYTAWHTHNTYAFDSMNFAPQKSGSYLVYRAPARAAEQILDRYEALGGEATFLYQLPDETTRLLRVTTPQMVSCLDAGRADPASLDKCYEKLAATMNFPALDPSLPPGTVLAERDVVDTAGQVGLILYRGSDATDVESTETVAATAEQSLGGNMPGLVISPDNPIALRHELRASGLVELGMLDFSRLSAQDAARIRALVANLAPAAQVNDTTTDAGLEAGLTLSVTAALATGMLALLIQLVTTAGAVTATRSMRIAISSVGPTRRKRAAISLAAVVPALGALVVAGLLVRYAAPELGYPTKASVGWVWLVPLVGPGAVVLVQARMSLKPPRR